MVNLKIVLNVIGVLLMLLGGLMLTALPFSLYYHANDTAPLISASGITVFSGLMLWWFTRHSDKTIGKREGYLIVAAGWVAIAVFSTLPYLFSGMLPGITDAFFESVSGLTTTGASVLNDIEAMPKDILFWRSLTQWIGGMGIIVLTVAIFPLLGIGGIELFVAEAPGPTADKIHPRIKETAKRLWFIYVGLTVLLTIILQIGGMSFYDAVNHALTTLSTGGFSTKNASIAHFDAPAIQYSITFFMFLAGTNYTIIYYSLKGNFKKAWKSDEFRVYLFFTFFLIVIVATILFQITDSAAEKVFRTAAFQIVSMVTTTGFVVADYTSWTPALTLLFFMLLFTGASAGSTSGGIKMIRHLVFFKNVFLELKRLLHPRAIIRIKIDRKLVAPRILTHIMVFLLLYVILFIAGSVTMSIIVSDLHQPILTSVGAVATALGNVGPAIGEVGPLNNFASVPDVGKWVLIFLMFLGRLELFTILILFTPYFWKMN